MKALKFLGLAVLLSSGMASSIFAQGVNATWNATANGNWTTGSNWTGGSYAGATSGNNTNTATFNNNTGVTVALPSAGIHINSVQFDTTVGSYTFNTGTFFVNSGGNIQLLNTVTSTGQTETINSNISAAGSLGISNLATTNDLLVINGNITNTKASGNNIISLGATNTGANIIAGIVSNGANATTSMNFGSGSWILSNANTFTGGANVSSGASVQISGSTASGNTVAVNSGGTLTATGTINGMLTVAAGGTLAGTGTASGTSFAIGGATLPTTVLVGQTSASDTNTTNSLTLAGTAASTITNAKLVFNLDTTNTNSNSLVFGATSVTFSGDSLTFNLQGGQTIGNGTTYILMTGSAANFNGLTGSTLTFDVNGTPVTNYSGSSLFISGSNLELVIQSVPEPSTWALMLGGLGLLLIFQRRRRSASL